MGGESRRASRESQFLFAAMLGVLFGCATAAHCEEPPGVRLSLAAWPSGEEWHALSCAGPVTAMSADRWAYIVRRLDDAEQERDKLRALVTAQDEQVMALRLQVQRLEIARQDADEIVRTWETTPVVVPPRRVKWWLPLATGVVLGYAAGQ